MVRNVVFYFLNEDKFLMYLYFYPTNVSACLVGMSSRHVHVRACVRACVHVSVHVHKCVCVYVCVYMRIHYVYANICSFIWELCHLHVNFPTDPY